jgi:Ca2+-transporting ATPase
MEKAIRELGGRALLNTGYLHSDWVLVREYPLTGSLLAMSHVWQSPGGRVFVVAAKGAPEAIADLCHLDGPARDAILEQTLRMAGDGLRVIGVARANFDLAGLPPHQHDFPFTFIGLLGLSDPVRPEVAGAVQECHTAGIRVIMITGDYPVTAQSIARQIGLRPLDQILTGPELDRMSDDELRGRIRTTCIVARAVPEQKLRIVAALKANGEVVAMTGDGVNDAPALKAAHIGIAMGGRGTDVARESASLVLLDDNFASIVQAIRMGRRIYDNLKKAMTFIFSVHIPIAGMSLIPILLQWPLALLPVHILFLELIIDPACTIVFEMEEDESDLMKRPPRTLGEPLFGRSMVFLGLIQGLGVLTAVFAVYAILLLSGFDEAVARMASFITLVIGNLGLIYTNRSRKKSLLATLRIPNRALWWVSGGAIGFLALVVAIPTLRELFRFAPLDQWQLALIAAACAISLAIAEGAKSAKVSRWISGGGKSGEPERKTRPSS